MVANRCIVLGKPTEYKGFYILTQCVGEFFQSIIFKDGEFFQTNILIKHKGPKNKWTNKELSKSYQLLLGQAMATCDLILYQNNPEELAKNDQDILGAVEQQEKVNKQTK